MKMFMTAVWIAGAVFLSVSCSSEQGNKKESAVSATRFPKLKDCPLELSVVSPRREYYAGEENAAITFSLKNIGLTPISLNEWYMYEPANINLYYAPGGVSETARLAPDEWKRSPTYDKNRRRIDMRSPLVLNPGTNRALVVVPLAFLKELKDAGRHVSYTVRGELNLQSVDVRSAPFEIIVK